MTNINKELDKIKERISNPNFLLNKGMANEVGIHIFCYDPKHEYQIRDFIKRVSSDATANYRIIEQDMYEIFMKILTEKRILDSMPGIEEKRGKEYLLTYLQNNIAKPRAFLEKMRYEPHERGRDVLFLTGVGKVFPFMRAHIMLNAMQEMFSDIPILAFYPGSFNGQDLALFNKIFEGNYYRAFNLIK